MTVTSELKDWLHQRGRDIAQQVGSHIREKGIAYAQDHLAMGMAAHMSAMA